MSDQADVQSRMEAFVDAADAPMTKEEEEIPVAEAGNEPPDQRTEAEKADAKEAEEADAPEETKEQRLLRLKHDGVEIEKPEDEVIALAQQGYDYTQKTQKLAEDRKIVETLAQTLKSQEQAFQQSVQVQSALTQDIAKVTAIDLQLSQYQNLDWQGLSNTDPVEAQKLFFAFTQLKTQRDQAVNEVQQKQQAFTHFQSEARAKQVALGQAVLAKEIPGWSPDLAKSLIATGKEYGFEDNELANITDPRAVKLLHDAAQWRKFQSTKSVADKKVATASPVVKPGAKDTKTVANANTKADRDNLRKTGKSEYAAKLIERML